MEMMTAKRTLALVLALNGSLITSHVYAVACYGTQIGERNSNSCQEVASSSTTISKNFYFFSNKDKLWIQCVWSIDGRANSNYCNPPLSPNYPNCAGQDLGRQNASSCKEVSPSQGYFFFQSKDTDKDGNLLGIQCDDGKNRYYCNP